MNRQEKQLVIESVKNDFAASQATFIIGVQGITVESMQGLKKNIRAKGGKVKVAKNTFLKIALNNLSGMSELQPYFKNQIAIVFAGSESPAVAKILTDSAKEIENLKIIAGSLTNRLIDKSQIEALASLPSREVLLAQVLGTLKAPVSGLANVLNQLTLRLLFALKEVANKKQ